MELSCERLYMRWADARSRAGNVGVTAGMMESSDSWDGEPPTEIVTESAGKIWAELQYGLTASDVVVVTGREWLADRDFGREVESHLTVFRAGGGRVE